MTDTFELKETEIQSHVFRHIDARGAPGVFAFHPKNASFDHRTKHRAGFAVGQGVKPGIPDVLVTKACDFEYAGPTPLHCYALELKRESRRGKKATPHEIKQKECRDEMEKAGWITGIAYGLDEALLWLESHNLLRGHSGK